MLFHPVFVIPHFSNVAFDNQSTDIFYICLFACTCFQSHMLISECYDTELFSLQLINVEQLVHKEWKLTDEGRKVAEYGSHEAVVYNAVPLQGILQSDLTVCQYSFHIQLQFTPIQCTKYNK
jgi:hypothetical protein